jgi:hydrogenase maturation protease
LGNPDRGDDGAGRMVARMLAGELPADVAIAELDGEVTSVLSCLQAADAAVLVDACSGGAAAGSVVRYDVVEQPLPEREFAVSTHGVSVASALELARALGDLPQTCIVYGIEGECFDAGAGLSAPVATAVREAARRVRAEFEHLQLNSGPVDA